MSACEKCWDDAGLIAACSGESKAEVYGRLIEQRKQKPCTPEEQAGGGAKTCLTCKRRTLHVYTGECMAGCTPNREEALRG